MNDTHSYEDLQEAWHSAHGHETDAKTAAARMNDRAQQIEDAQQQLVAAQARLAALQNDQAADGQSYERSRRRAETLRAMVTDYCAKHHLQTPPDPPQDGDATVQPRCDWADCGQPIAATIGLGDGWKHVATGRPECHPGNLLQLARPAQPGGPTAPATPGTETAVPAPLAPAPLAPAPPAAATVNGSKQ